MSGQIHCVEHSLQFELLFVRTLLEALCPAF